MIFGALDKNTTGEENYKQLLELLMGAEEAQRLFAAAQMGLRPTGPSQTVQFVMPLQPSNPQSKIMGEIGWKIIKGGKNYEEEFKSRIGQAQAISSQPTTSSQAIYNVLDTCGVKLTIDERNTLEAYLSSNKD